MSTLPPAPMLADSTAEEADARALLQSRLLLLGKITFALSGGFLLIAFLIDTSTHELAVAVRTLALPGRSLNAAGALVSGALWALTARGQRSVRFLIVIDSVTAVLAVASYALMSLLGEHGMAAVLLASLCTQLVLVLRAVLVPSRGRRTAWIGLASATLVVALAAITGIAPDTSEGAASQFDLYANLVLWSVVAAVAASLLSWVLFGLRTAIRDARRLGQYTLVERLGGGGMGEVYRAKHAFLRRPTAVKLLPSSRPGDRSLVRFEREVQLTASLVHPNTIRIFDYGRTADGVFYYAMELLEGGDLDSVVDVDGPQSAARTIHIGAQVASSLAEAHAVGLVHRDIKPENILLCSKGVPDFAKVLDFGLVLDVERAGQEEQGLIVGTPAFISPEAIARPDDVGPASDVYSLGCVLYFLLTGEFVFEGESVTELCARHLADIPAPPSSRTEQPIPPALERLVLACLEKEPAARPESASALRTALLACDAPPWTEADAHAWWQRFGPSVTAVVGERAAAVSESRVLSVVRSGR